MGTSANAKDHLLDLDGIEIAVRTWGPEDGIPVLAVHGWLDNAASFERLAPLLDGCFVVAPDLVGHGRSDHRRDDSGYYLWEHAEDMLAVVDSLGWSRFMCWRMAWARDRLDSRGADQRHRQPAVPRRHGRTVHRGRGRPSRAHGAPCGSSAAAAQPPAGFCRPRRCCFDNLEQALGQCRSNWQATCAAAARLMALRDLLQVGDGYCWRHDPRLDLPEPMPLTEREACELLQQIRCPLYLLLGQQGAFAGDGFDRRQAALPGQTRVTWHPGGTTSICRRRARRWRSRSCAPWRGTKKADCCAWSTNECWPC
jgi:pimeloyl-ACP methyl ester carboxylesterase